MSSIRVNTFSKSTSKSLQPVGHGFTLIELLVVISIISLLISILLPALSSARKASQRVSCGSREKQLGVAMAAYVADSKGFLTIVNQSSVEPKYWSFSLAPYLYQSYTLNTAGYKKMAPSFTCPTHTAKYQSLGKETTRNYAMNMYLGLNSNASTSFWRR